jgi:hypothetical protein
MILSRMILTFMGIVAIGPLLAGCRQSYAATVGCNQLVGKLATKGKTYLGEGDWDHSLLHYSFGLSYKC